MPPYDTATTVTFNAAPAGTIGAAIIDLPGGGTLRARSTGGITDISTIPGNYVYRVLLSNAQGRDLDTDWGMGVQLVVDDGASEFHYDLDHLINAQRLKDFVTNPNVNLERIRGLLAEQDGDGRLVVRAAAVGLYPGAELSSVGGNNLFTFFNNGGASTTKHVNDVGTGASGGTGSGGVTFITPIMASAANPRYSTRDLPPIAQGSSPVDVVSVTSGSGAPVGLTGRTLRLIAYLVTDDKGTDTRYDDTLAPAFMYETTDGGLTIGGPSGNEVSIHHDPDKTATPGEYRYFLWDITDLVGGKGGIVLMKGKYPIEPAVRSLVAA